MEKSAKMLLYFGLDCGMLEFFAHKCYVSPAFLEHGSVEKIAVLAHANRDPNKEEFLHEVAQNFELLSNIQDQK